jgi:hypothetical protein
MHERRCITITPRVVNHTGIIVIDATWYSSTAGAPDTRTVVRIIWALRVSLYALGRNLWHYLTVELLDQVFEGDLVEEEMKNCD